jgi:hypothetical protein
MSYCSPSYSKYKYTCFNKKALVNIAISYNNKNNNTISTNQDKKKLYEDINNKFHQICNDERCWLVKTNQYHLEKKYFKPSKPCNWQHNPNTWLNSTDIENVMIQYQDAFQKFNFMGVFPIDFNEKDSVGNCISNELCNIDIKKFTNSKKKSFGAIFNLDRHNEPGSHWVALFMCFDKSNPNYGVFYYDSVANDIPPQVLKFMKYIKHSVKDKNFKFKKNTIRHQYKNTECGMYSIHFILECLNNKKVDLIYKTKINDDEMTKFRDIYFKPNDTCSR